ncbi:MAG: F0F1 ATP synthase subunit A [Armatimonadota bacterium]
MNDWLAQPDTSPILIAQHTGHEAASTHETATTPETATEPAEGGHGGGWSPHVWLYASPFFAFLIVLLVVVLGTRRLQLVPRGIQNAVEFLVESLNAIPEMVMGPRGRQYAPFISSFFLYILVVNLTGLVPPFKAGTASLSVTVGLGVVAFIAVQVIGFREKGIGYLGHFLGPVSPKRGMKIVAFLGSLLISLVILPLELISELIRPISLSFRLYGNIFGDEQVVEALAIQFSPLVAVMMLPLQVIVSILQALVFTLLVTVYISLATEKHDEHAEGEEAHAH